MLQSMYSRIIALLMIYALSLTRQASSVLLRVRLEDGTFHRIDIEDSCPIGSIKDILASNGLIESENAGKVRNITSIVNADVNIKFRSRLLEDLGQSLSSPISALSPKPGEIIDLALKHRERNSETSVSQKKASPAKTFAERKKKKALSISDLEKRRKELVKITAQKVSANKCVNIAPTTARILNRLPTATGNALLLGRMHREILVGKSPAANSNISTYEVIGVIEIPNLGDDFGVLVKDEYIKNVLPIAEGLGLRVIGCAIARNSSQSTCFGQSLGISTDKSEKGKKDEDSGQGRSGWDTRHVLACLQLSSSLASCSSRYSTNDTLVVLSVSNEKTPSEARSTTGKRPMPPSPFGKRHAQGSQLQIEAFQLSEQARKLAQRDILPVTGNDEQRKLGNKILLLKGDVLVQSNEVSRIDPILLAVPLPIISHSGDKDGKGSGQKVVSQSTFSRLNSRRGKITTSQQIPVGFSKEEFHAISDGMEHSFPTELELKQSETFAVAEKHLLKIVSQPLASETKARLRDPHLLMFLRDRIEPGPIKQLCKFLVTSMTESAKHRYPPQVAIAFDGLRTSLQIVHRSRRETNSDEDE